MGVSLAARFRNSRPAAKILWNGPINGQCRFVQTQTLVEKIVQRHATGLAPGQILKSGDFVTISPAKCMTHDNTWPVAKKFMDMGFETINRKDQIVLTLDHDIQNRSETNLRKYANIENFAKKHDLWFSPAGKGIGHQRMIESGMAWPGTLVVASDSHSTHYGALGCLGTPCVRTDAAAIWATSQTWWQIPPIARVNLLGSLPPGVTAKDVLITLCSVFKDDVHNHAVEFVGPGVASLNASDRQTMSNMSTEWGALASVFPIDSVTERFLRGLASGAAVNEDHSMQERVSHQRIDALFADPPVADPDAVYAKQLWLNLSSLSACVTGPNSTKLMTPAHEIAEEKIKIDRAYIVSCTNARASDFAAAAKVVREAATTNSGIVPKVADHTKLYIAAASAIEQEKAESAGDWQILKDAGAIEMASGCAQCIGLGNGLLEAGETGISASNRNYVGRLGSRDSLAYLSSPEVVASSALAGYITPPAFIGKRTGSTTIAYGYGTGKEDAIEDVIQQLDSMIERVEAATGSEEEKSVEILSGFPEKIEGEIVFCRSDNINTDGIYPGALTYQDDVSKSAMADACFSNYDPEFKNIAKSGDIVVGGYNFGCGSSREQAATAILAKGIQLVVAGSVGATFARNGINNALVTLELPKLVDRLREAFSGKGLEARPSVRTGWNLIWDVRKSTIEVQEGENGSKWSEKVGALPPNVQAIIAAGGLEAWCKQEVGRRQKESLT